MNKFPPRVTSFNSEVVPSTVRFWPNKVLPSTYNFPFNDKSSPIVTV